MGFRDPQAHLSHCPLVSGDRASVTVAAFGSTQKYRWERGLLALAPPTRSETETAAIGDSARSHCAAAGVGGGCNSRRSYALGCATATRVPSMPARDRRAALTHVPGRSPHRRRVARRCLGRSASVPADGIASAPVVQWKARTRTGGKWEIQEADRAPANHALVDLHPLHPSSGSRTLLGQRYSSSNHAAFPRAGRDGPHDELDRRLRSCSHCQMHS